jgi:phage tail sheath gpL-like
MPIFQVITVTIDETQANMDRDLIAETGHTQLAGLKLKDFFKRVTSGIRPATVRTENDAVKASGTLTLTSVIATDAVVINGQTLTAVASGATTDQWNLGASDTEAATNLAAKINAHAAFTGICTATSSETVVTVSAARPGKIGNAITLVSNDATIVASAARLANGTDGASDRTHYYGSAS